MTFEMLVLLLVGVFGLLIPVALYYRFERPEAGGGSWFRSRQGIGRPSSQTIAMLRRWYAGRACAMCSHPIAPVQGNSRPGFLDRAGRRTMAWDEVPEADVPRALEQYEPICAGCFTAESFRALYPDLVVDRVSTPLRDSATH